MPFNLMSYDRKPECSTVVFIYSAAIITPHLAQNNSLLCGIKTETREILSHNETRNVQIAYQRGAFLQPLLQRKSNEYYSFWVCVRSLRCPACKAHAPYYIFTCGLVGCTAFFYILITRFSENVISHKTRLFIFSATFVWKQLSF